MQNPSCLAPVHSLAVTIKLEDKYRLDFAKELFYGEYECNILTMLNLLTTCPLISGAITDITFKLSKLFLSVFLVQIMRKTCWKSNFFRKRLTKLILTCIAKASLLNFNSREKKTDDIKHIKHEFFFQK
jgi:hypothetical protein